MVQLTILANDSAGEPLEDDGAVFSHGQAFFEDVKGWMIRAAIAYLKDLQSKPLTKQRLIKKGMLGSAYMDTEPEVVVGIYEANIQEGINLLNTWVRERRDPSAPDPSMPLPRQGQVRVSKAIERTFELVRSHNSAKRLATHGESVMATGYPLDSWTEDENCNYHLGPIPKRSIPGVLKRLKMTGLWRVIRWFGELEPYHCQEIAAFLNRVMPFFRRQGVDPLYAEWWTANEFISEIKRFKRVFELCPEDGSVSWG